MLASHQTAQKKETRWAADGKVKVTCNFRETKHSVVVKKKSKVKRRRQTTWIQRGRFTVAGLFFKKKTFLIYYRVSLSHSPKWKINVWPNAELQNSFKPHWGDLDNNRSIQFKNKKQAAKKRSWALWVMLLSLSSRTHGLLRRWNWL